MNYRITNASISYGAETILEEINFEVKGNEKLAIVGRNGSGKSTLLKAIVNNELLEEGIGEEKFNIYKEGNPVIGYLYLMQKEKNKILTKTKKLERDIEENEVKVKNLNEKLLKEEIYTDYQKVQEIQDEIDKLKEKIDDNMKKWEELQENLDKL